MYPHKNFSELTPTEIDERARRFAEEFKKHPPTKEAEEVAAKFIQFCRLWVARNPQPETELVRKVRKRIEMEWPLIEKYMNE